MAFLHQVEFTIGPEHLSELEIGASLERVIGYLRTLLPGEPGFISARAYQSLKYEPVVHVQVASLWDTWEDLLSHRDSALAEDKILSEFEPHVQIDDLRVSIYREVE